MKFGAQVNEIAGSMLQELPPGTSITVSTGAPAQPGASKTVVPVDFSRVTDFQWLVSAPFAKSSNLATPVNAANLSQPALDSLNQVEKLISREVVMVRQSGAESLAVTLKVDSQTSLFLQLTNHNGQVEAAVRCEKGDAGALAGHWAQLQESLARQNVQLQPMDKQTPIHLPSQPTLGNEGQPDLNRHQPPLHTPPPSPLAEEKSQKDDALGAAINMSKSKHKSHNHHGWEKWA